MDFRKKKKEETLAAHERDLFEAKAKALGPRIVFFVGLSSLGVGGTLLFVCLTEAFIVWFFTEGLDYCEIQDLVLSVGKSYVDT